MIPFRDNIPTRIKPVVTVGLILINCAVFLYQRTLPDQVYLESVYLLGTIPVKVLHPESWLVLNIHNPLVSLFSAMFLHGGWLHLGGNMLYLWIFGNNVEDSMGHFRFIVFYLLCGLAAAGAQVFSAPDSTVPMIGASGAVAGVLGAYLILYPFARIQTLIIIIFFIKVIELPAILVLLFWFLIQVANGLGSQTGAGGVAWHAHIGGFIVGLMMIRFFQNRRLRRKTFFGR